MAMYKSEALCQVLTQRNRKMKVTSYDLTKRWNIGLEPAKKPLLRTTQTDIGLPQIRCCLNGIVQMIECSGTEDCIEIINWS